MHALRFAASLILFAISVAIALPSLLGIHIAEVIGELSNELWERS
jgi:hypothetical protein